ncbi:UvrD-helicase domain-containing protein [Riemerella columbipharyngis]|uniref:DNA 3'-5' helicase n=1 Tax=Riemerella columbipharyngis TaxID=1071918 RepID=A0A1G6YCX2_9FLAO|nr:UvrD-helicase domain-containing protein [Riemerella columbipharyngis]SDD88190.1 ATP-dependent exoDNAse (exonuclease V) beta subunit (contains helicase and exonuclease domains) [Riemerella columbipharyngis]
MHSYTAINASAGSGKTYALAIRVLSLCLKDPNGRETIRHILALTFTNKAANEMKSRILEWLLGFTKEDYKTNSELKSIKKYLKENGINISIEDLHERSKKLLDYILHNYSVLNIGTIDKFNSKLIRSFAFELGLPQNFNIEINNEPFLVEAVERLLDKVGDDEILSKTLLDLMYFHLENDERVHLNQSLYEAAKEFIKDTNYEQLKENKSFDQKAYEETKDKIRAFIKEKEEKIKSNIRKGCDIIQESGLTVSDFKGGTRSSIAKYFLDNLLFSENKTKELKIPKDKERSMANFKSGTASKNQSIRDSVDGALTELIPLWEEITKDWIEIEKIKKILKELLPLTINKNISDELNLIEEENELVLLSKFNVIINENLKDEPSAFIYEKVGTKFQHYFFDEFQDTSKMQWKNIIPLRNHTISSEDHTFTIVGDPKQSIYRFRGGDSELMLGIINEEEAKKDGYTSVKINVENLENNWRSAKNIVDFNNKLYATEAENLEPKHKRIFGDLAIQKAKKNHEGRVRINLISHNDFHENAAEKIHHDIQECINNGFEFSDICILCRNGKDIASLSLELGKKEVTYHGSPSKIKTISERGLALELSLTLRALMAFINWELSSENREYLVKMLYYLNENKRIEIKSFTEDLQHILNLKSPEAIKDFLAEKYDLELRQKGLFSLNLYNYIEECIQVLSVSEKETNFLLTFLEVAYNFAQIPGKTLKDFVKYWDDEAKGQSVQSSENIDAIKFMTIHSAKGLEFPVVMYPILIGSNKKKSSDWYSVEDMGELRYVNIKPFNTQIAGYDEKAKEYNDAIAYKEKIDDLCVQYVATTRPEQQLFLYIQRQSDSSQESPSVIMDFVQKINSTEDSFDLYPEVGSSYKKLEKKEEDFSANILSIKEIKPSQKVDNIRIATPSKSYKNRNEKVRQGIFIHEILSKIKSENDIAKVLGNYLLEGLISQDEKTEIENRILAIVRNSLYQKYFSGFRNVINERAIMVSDEQGAHLYRPDRIVETEDGCYIVDFKTGEEKKEHRKQIEQYQALLEQIGKKVIGTEIIYI